MNIAVVGVGAMGCLLGASLGGLSDVILVGHWPEQVAAIAQHGLWLEHPDGRRSHHRPRITAGIAAVGRVDVALVAVKSRQTAVAAAEIARFLAPDGLAVTLQNGLNNRATLRGVLGDRRVSLGVTSEGATVLGVAEVRHAGHGLTHFGRDEALGEAQQARLPELVELFNRAGFATQLVDDIDGLVWGKLAVNAAINPLTALLRVPNGFLLEHEPLVALMSEAAREVAAVADAQGIALPYDDAAERAIAVARATAANRSSMLQDIQRGAPTEVEAICGAVARVGRELGVPTPVNIRLCRLVRRTQSGDPPLATAGDVTGLLRLMSKESTH
ncbi:MAG: ketopantoate reductase family protein [Candidatus Promineofilum sp.]|nr:ketopantoate reductase family protein [Promineifilum sp.]